MSDCLFCKIRDGKIPAKIVHRDERCLAFHDINPQAPTHLLIIPTEHISTVNELTDAHREAMGQLFLAASALARQLGLSDSGYRLVVNTGSHAGQTVFHLHLHLLGGRPMHWPPG